MVSATDKIKALPINQRREAVREILESFPENDPLFDNVEGEAEETVSNEIKQLLDEREKQMASGSVKWHTREEMDLFLLNKKLK